MRIQTPASKSKHIMNYSGKGDDKVPLSASYLAEGTYPADICVLRYALERNAHNKPGRNLCSLRRRRALDLCADLAAGRKPCRQSAQAWRSAGRSCRSGVADIPFGAAGNVRHQLSRGGLCASKSGLEGILAGARAA